MSTFTFRRPLNSQKNVGGDMFMSFFGLPRHPTVFGSFDPLQLMKSFNVETIAKVRFPEPEWITTPNCKILQAHDRSDWAYFSLNIAMYPSTLIPSDWDGKWFFMSARVHPYVLTWEMEPTNPLSNDGPQHYTVPILMIRDGYYQP
jgi:hypothetical protein